MTMPRDDRTDRTMILTAVTDDGRAHCLICTYFATAEGRGEIIPLGPSSDSIGLGAQVPEKAGLWIWDGPEPGGTWRPATLADFACFGLPIPAEERP
jgi:hypothetical protein